MKTFIIAALCLVFGFAGAYILFGSGEKQAHTDNATEETTRQYTCGMHPEIISNEPGYCPLCGMKLTPKKDGSSTSGSIKIDPTTTQNMNIKTAIAKNIKLSKELSVYGTVGIPDQNIYAVNVKIDGWVEKLFVNETGVHVYSGQPLFEIYSPKLVAAQNEFLIARDKLKSAQFASSESNGLTGFYDNARNRLVNFDINEDQIKILAESGEVKRSLTIRAPYDGVVIDKKIVEGDKIRAGNDLYHIADLSSVWVKAFVYEDDLPYISLNMPAEVKFPNIPGESFRAKVAYISPYLDQSRQVEIRIEVDNKDYLLKPDMFAEVVLNYAKLTNSVAIPRSAIINSGKRKLVFVSESDSFSRREIETGIVGKDDMIEVRSGIDEGDIIVVSGQFMLDSESRLNEVLADGGGGAHSGHNHGGMAMTETENEPDKDEQHEHDVYTCPMPEHFNIMQYGEGKCSECGMDLVSIYETDNKNAYVCPMPECETVSNEEGRCPVCGMFLKKLSDYDSNAAKSGESLSGIYTCPMVSHYHVLQHGEGKCPECEMTMIPVEESTNNNVHVCPTPGCESVSNKKERCPTCGIFLIPLNSGDGNDK